MSKRDPSPQSSVILYQTEDGRTRLEVRLQNETVWLSLNQMAELFQRDKSVISRHIKNVFEEGELVRGSVVAEYATTAADGKTYQVEFATVQNKMHWAVHGQTAAEVIHARADASRPFMGLKSTRPGGIIRREDVAIAKNYLDEPELQALNRIVNAYIEFAELQALNRRVMTMSDWVEKLDAFLRLSDRELLDHAGKITAEGARAKAESEYDRYRALMDAQPRPVDAHFDEAVKQMLPPPKPDGPKLSEGGKS